MSGVRNPTERRSNVSRSTERDLGGRSGTEIDFWSRSCNERGLGGSGGGEDTNRGGREGGGELRPRPDNGRPRPIPASLLLLEAATISPALESDTPVVLWRP